MNSNYTEMRGTSMATPHVAGSAAILAQQHPDWTGQQLKAALMGASKVVDPKLTVYQQGAGRVRWCVAGFELRSGWICRNDSSPVTFIV